MSDFQLALLTLVSFVLGAAVMAGGMITVAIIEERRGCMEQPRLVPHNPGTR
jgi:hypothetical protein